MSQLLLRPRVSEKAMALAEQNIYVFEVPTSANKQEIAKAVEEAFKVTVTDVTTLVAKGKTVQWRRGSKRIAGTRRDVKKAMVTLQKGQKIKIFDEGGK